MSLSCRKLLTSEEKSQAINIVAKEYAKSGYIQSEKEMIPSSVYLCKETSFTYGLFLDEKMIGTISIILDSKRGLPMDTLFQNSLDVFRKNNQQLAEVTQLAISEDIFSQYNMIKKNIERLRFLSILFRTILQTAKTANRSALCIMINPKHDGFYTQIGFQSIAETKNYTRLQNAPAVPKIFFLQDTEKQSMKNVFIKNLFTSL